MNILRMRVLLPPSFLSMRLGSYMYMSKYILYWVNVRTNLTCLVSQPLRSNRTNTSVMVNKVTPGDKVLNKFKAYSCFNKSTLRCSFFLCNRVVLIFILQLSDYTSGSTCSIFGTFSLGTSSQCLHQNFALTSLTNDLRYFYISSSFVHWLYYNMIECLLAVKSTKLSISS